jgi:hypothetical protein
MINKKEMVIRGVAEAVAAHGRLWYEPVDGQYFGELALVRVMEYARESAIEICSVEAGDNIQVFEEVVLGAKISDDTFIDIDNLDMACEVVANDVLHSLFDRFSKESIGKLHSDGDKPMILKRVYFKIWQKDSSDEHGVMFKLRLAGKLVRSE